MGALLRARELSVSAKLLLAAIALAVVVVPGTFALDSATGHNNRSSFSTTTLYWPSGLTATPSGGNQTLLSWTEPTSTGNGNGYAILGYHATGAVACPSTPSTYSFIIGVATGTTSLTDTSAYGGGTSSYWGTYSCYLIQTWYVPGNPAPGAPAWSSATVGWAAQGTATYIANAVQIGFVAQAVGLTNSDGSASAGDTVAVTYNQAASAQPASPALTSLVVCFGGSNKTIYLGQTAPTSGTCSTSGSSVGTLTGGSYAMLSGSKDAWFAISAAAFSGNVLTISLGSLLANKQPVSMTGTWTLTPSISAQSGNPLIESTANPSVPCNTGSACLPTTTTAF